MTNEKYKQKIHRCFNGHNLIYGINIINSAKSHENFLQKRKENTI